jgi:hypothetical protein
MSLVMKQLLLWKQTRKKPIDAVMPGKQYPVSRVISPAISLPPTNSGITELRSLFGVPETLTGAKEYQFYGSCSGGRFAELTVVQLDDNGVIRWKYVKVDSIQVVTSISRCVLGPSLLLAILYILYAVYQEKTATPVRRI